MTEKKWISSNGRSGSSMTSVLPVNPSQGGGESGILRKTSGYNAQDNFDDLLVFGYSCKIFRDDAKALHIDQGKHLIPSMADSSLKIDRYDARGALHDLTPYEAPPGGYTNRIDCLTAAEQRAELLCEEERYYSMYKNEVEEELYAEEEAKRKENDYGQVAFNYDSTDALNAVKVDDKNVEEETDEPFVAPANFEIPGDIELPESMKEHAIIEKTAKFIANQGSQMEILLKAKQSNNLQFDFLNQNSKLYRYYSHVMMSIRNKTYPVQKIDTEDEAAGKENGQSEGSSSQNIDNLLIPDSYSPLKFSVPAVKYIPSADCAYTQLISKITGTPIPIHVPSIVEPPKLIQIPKAMPKSQSLIDNAPGQQIGDVEVKKISTGLMGLSQYTDSESEDHDDENNDHHGVEYREIEYHGVMPPDYLQHIIDKTAAYVVKNGRDFEDSLRTKNDPRFLFLEEKNEFNAYYTYKVRHTMNPYEITVIKKSEKAEKSEKIKSETLSKPQTDVPAAPIVVVEPVKKEEKPKVIAPVSFSIKAKEEPSVPLKPALPQEESDEEEPCKTSDKVLQDKELTPPPPPTISNETRITTPPPPICDPIDFHINNEVVEEQKQSRLAEERLKDKLAIAAREKLGLLSREKQLQLERKKRAMAFLNQIKSSGPNEESSNKNGNSNPTTNESGDDESDASIHSIPSPPQISSYQIAIIESEPEADDDDVQIVSSKAASRSSRSRTPTKSPRSRTRSRSRSKSKSRSRSKSSSLKHKKKKSKHSKKKSKRKSRSRSRSRSKSYSSRYRSYSRSPERKYRKHSHKSSSRRD